MWFADVNAKKEKRRDCRHTSAWISRRKERTTLLGEENKGESSSLLPS